MWRWTRWITVMVSIAGVPLAIGCEGILSSAPGTDDSTTDGATRSDGGRSRFDSGMPPSGVDGGVPMGVDSSTPPMGTDGGPPPMRDGGPPPGRDSGPPPPMGPCTLGAPLAEPIAGCMPALAPSTGDIYEDCVRRINAFRCECQHLQPLERWVGGEACADQQAEYDSTRDPHSGFRDGICGGGYAQNECPGWPSDPSIISGCLQAMWDEGPGEFYGGHGHYINMSSTTYSQVACGFYDGPGGVWAVQNFH